MKKDVPTAPKLNKVEQNVVKQMLAEFCEWKEIQEYLQTEYSKKITRQGVLYYEKQYDVEIKELRVQMRTENGLYALPISEKYYRLKLRQKLIADLLENLWLEEKRQVGSGKNAEIYTKLVGNHLHINKILDSAREEVDGPALNINITNIDAQIEAFFESRNSNTKDVSQSLIDRAGGPQKFLAQLEQNGHNGTNGSAQSKADRKNGGNSKSSNSK